MFKVEITEVYKGRKITVSDECSDTSAKGSTAKVRTFVLTNLTWIKEAIDNVTPASPKEDDQQDKEEKPTFQTYSQEDWNRMVGELEDKK